MKLAYRDKDDRLRSLDQRMQECGHRFHRFSELRQVCLDCEAARDEALYIDDVMSDREAYLRQEGRGDADAFR